MGDYNLESSLENEVLVICSSCHKIKSPNPGWFSREENPSKYDSLLKTYKESLRLFHGCCPPCYESALKEL